MRLNVASGIMLALLMVSMSTVVSNVIPAKATSDPPIHVHLTWQNETDTTMTVTWQTNTSTAGDTILYDPISRGGDPASYSYSASGFNYTYSGASGYIHDVELTDLSPDTVYYFICGGDTGGWSSERAFRTAPSVSSDVRFVVGGDSRTYWEERENISKAMAKFNPAFAMHSGDMVTSGTDQSHWDGWFTDVDSNWIGENNLTIPIIPALGNHEAPEIAGCKYFVQFALPDNEKWYSYNWGPYIHIICLDSEVNASGASGLQRDWLENDLATHADYTWKFVLFHRPPFVSGYHSPWPPALTYWVPLFDKYHVDVVFTGHEHSYQRSYPLNWTASETEPQDYSNGTMYIVSGGWGAPLHNATPIWYMAYQNMTYHFCLLDVFKNGTLHLQAKDNQGNTFDEVTIYKYEINVPAEYSTIQAAINAANPGDSIFVSSGTYYEHVVVNKTVSLVGDPPIIDGSEIGNVIEIRANNVVIEKFTLRNAGGNGILLERVSNCIIKNNNITANDCGIYLNESSNNNISGNNIRNNDYGIKLYNSSNNAISGNSITANNLYGVYFQKSSNNKFYHNNFVDNSGQVYSDGSINVWDDGYPSGGNYWSDHNPPDIYSGPHQNETDGDRIGDTPYIIDENNTDRYPLIYPYGYVPTIDLNIDGRISITDIVLCALAFGSKPGDPIWRPYADLNQDGKISITDIVMIALHFGEEW